jgi:hypothetical protein
LQSFEVFTASKWINIFGSHLMIETEQAAEILVFE